MFVDKVSVSVKAGKGGNGAVSFRHEKWVDRGGPDGGDGGDGGNVVFIARQNQSTLANFRFQPKLEAKDGVNGSKQKKRGARGSDLLVEVPIGTMVHIEEKTVADFTSEGQKQIIARGGKGGYGNAHFTSSTRQAPKVAEIGEKGESFNLVLELKLLADVGLVGLPNAGKSTFLSEVSNAHPEIADYPFTTLSPNLGVTDFDGGSILIADIPGLIEGASEGKGLGDEFLRHIERTRVLLHLIDINEKDIVGAYKTIRCELANYQVNLSDKPTVLALTKIDQLPEKEINNKLKEIKKAIDSDQEIFTISSVSKKNLKQCLRSLRKIVDQEKEKNEIIEGEEDKIPIIKLGSIDERWEVKKMDEEYLVEGVKICRFAERTDFQNEHSIRRLRDIMRKMGIMHQLERQGINPGDKISFNGIGEKLEY